MALKLCRLTCWAIVAFSSVGLAIAIEHLGNYERLGLIALLFFMVALTLIIKEA